MKRLMFLIQDLQTAERVVAGLREIDIAEEMMHIIARDRRSLELAHLHSATVMETSELETDFNWGLVAGGTLGLVLGFILYGSAIMGIEFGASGLLVLVLSGSVAGGWLGKLIGESTPNSALQKYQSALDAGQILMMVDVAAEAMPQVYTQVRRHCPAALIESVHLFHDHPLST